MKTTKNKSKGKRLLSVLLTAAMVCSILPAMAVSAAADATVSDETELLAALDNVADGENGETISLSVDVPAPDEADLLGSLESMVSSDTISLLADVPVSDEAGLLAALDNLADGDTISLSADITVSGIGGDLIIGETAADSLIEYKLDLNGHALTIENDLIVRDYNKNMEIIDSAGGGELVVMKNVSAYNGTTGNSEVGHGIYANGAKVTVHGDITSWSYGVLAENGAKVAVSGNITNYSLSTAIVCWNAGTTVTVGTLSNPVTVTANNSNADGVNIDVNGDATIYGDIVAGYRGAVVQRSSTLTVYGNVTANNDQGVEAYSESTIVIYGNLKSADLGINCSQNSSVTVTGSVTSNDIGISAYYGAVVTVTGSVTAAGNGVVCAGGSMGAGGSTVLIEGELTAGSSSVYIRLLDNSGLFKV